MLNRDSLKNDILRLEKQAKQGPKIREKLEKLKDEYYQATANYSLQYPENLSDVMPTRFGNILKAAENYSGERYGFDNTSFWPRLMQVIPDEYKLTIDSSRNDLLFHVNMSVLSIVFSLLCCFAIFYTMATVPVERGNPENFLLFVNTSLRFLVAASFGMICSFFFYNTSIMSAKSFSLVIRTGVDLFRMDLLKKFGVRTPKDSIEEFETWNNLNELIIMGSHSLTFKKINYWSEK